MHRLKKLFIIIGQWFVTLIQLLLFGKVKILKLNKGTIIFELFLNCFFLEGGGSEGSCWLIPGGGGQPAPFPSQKRTFYHDPKFKRNSSKGKIWKVSKKISNAMKCQNSIYIGYKIQPPPPSSPSPLWKCHSGKVEKDIFTSFIPPPKILSKTTLTLVFFPVPPIWWISMYNG